MIKIAGWEPADNLPSLLQLSCSPQSHKHKLVATVWLLVTTNPPRGTLPRWIRRRKASPSLCDSKAPYFYFLPKPLSSLPPMVTFHPVLTVKMAPEHNHNDESHQPALPLERAEEVRSARWNRVRRGCTVWRRKDRTDATRWHTCRAQPPNVSNLIYGWRRKPTATPFLRTTSFLLSVSLSPLFPPHFNHLTANIRFPVLCSNA